MNFMPGNNGNYTVKLEYSGFISKRGEKKYRFLGGKKTHIKNT